MMAQAPATVLNHEVKGTHSKAACGELESPSFPSWGLHGESWCTVWIASSRLLSAEALVLSLVTESNGNSKSLKASHWEQMQPGRYSMTWRKFLQRSFPEAGNILHEAQWIARFSENPESWAISFQLQREPTVPGSGSRCPRVSEGWEDEIWSQKDKPQPRSHVATSFA